MIPINSTTVASPIPFHIEARQRYKNSHLTEHVLSFGVVGVEEPARIVIASDVYGDPQIIERRSRGGLELPARLADALAINCFKLIAAQINEHGGDSARWTISDITRFVRNRFNQADAEQILKGLSLQVTPGLVADNVCLVADDDAI